LTATMASRLTRIPERVLVEEMDRARRTAEQCTLTHDRIAYELGYERVRVNHIVSGDRLVYVERGQRQDRTVARVDHRVDDVSSVFYVTFDGSAVRSFEDGDFVSRVLPPINEAF